MGKVRQSNQLGHSSLRERPSRSKVPAKVSDDEGSTYVDVGEVTA